ncbi:hypothetical protein IMZ11_31435 [Microtetraspora sp. AC03309]|uniref:hypothetical protein n=1 Tax=Microtetraspora sp. AC03309 TaxID=2779376 RepID=UPI001E41C740|nr:hypothetical protein [Microtetraspora sp. AC03309]MCC5580148.1 hypothetical protein [Microtetraspora sp. AC03309]
MDEVVTSRALMAQVGRSRRHHDEATSIEPRNFDRAHLGHSQIRPCAYPYPAGPSWELMLAGPPGGFDRDEDMLPRSTGK